MAEISPPPPPQFVALSLLLGQLFGDPFLVEVPAYQRSFAWTADEAGRLLEDISAAMEGGEAGEPADYFIGAMLFIDRDGTEARPSGWPMTGAPRVFEVVDGLQRLTTLTILFCVLRDLDEDDDAPPYPPLLAAIRTAAAGAKTRLSLRGPDEQFLTTHVLASGASHVMPESEEIPPAAANILAVREHFVSSLMDLDRPQRRRLADFLLQRCSVVLIATTGLDRAHRMFMVLNDTGKPLARNDILKAELLGRVPAAAANAAAATWDALEGRLGHDFESLFSHVRAMYGRPGGQVISGVRAIAREAGGAQPFIDGVLQPAAEAFDDIRNARHAGSPHSPTIIRTLVYLARLAAADWVPAAMLWWTGPGRDATELVWFLGAIDRLAHGLRILGVGSGRRAQRFGAVITAIRGGQDLRAATSPLNFSREELRTIAFNLRDLHVRSAQTAKLVLMRLNDEIAKAQQSAALQDYTVEHVLARRHGANSQWRTWYPNPQEREACTESLGNLVLVTKAQNDKAGNLDFARKREVYFNTPGVVVPAINELLRNQREWKAQQIKAREAELLRCLQTLWGFGAGNGAEAPDRKRGRRRG